MTIVACIKRYLHIPDARAQAPARAACGDCAKCAPAYWVGRFAVDFGEGGLI